MKISRPINMSIVPPRMPALPANAVPNLRPRKTPRLHMTNVTAAIIRTDTTASAMVCSAMVKPTESASIEVATP